jgi:hypothetical protein
MMKSIPAVALVLCVTALGACGRKAPEPPGGAPKPAPAAEKAVAKEPVALEEPSEEVLGQLMIRAYERLDAAGGMPMTATATGQSGRVRMKISEVRKSDCKLAVDRLPGLYECSVAMQVKYWWAGQPEPDRALEDNKRIEVIRDDEGTWLDCTNDAQSHKEYCDVTASRKRRGLAP